MALSRMALGDMDYSAACQNMLHAYIYESLSAEDCNDSVLILGACTGVLQEGLRETEKIREIWSHIMGF